MLALKVARSARPWSVELVVFGLHLFPVLTTCWLGAVTVFVAVEFLRVVRDRFGVDIKGFGEGYKGLFWPWASSVVFGRCKDVNLRCFRSDLGISFKPLTIARDVV